MKLKNRKMKRKIRKNKKLNSKFDDSDSDDNSDSDESEYENIDNNEIINSLNYREHHGEIELNFNDIQDFFHFLSKHNEYFVKRRDYKALKTYFINSINCMMEAIEEINISQKKNYNVSKNSIQIWIIWINLFYFFLSIISFLSLSSCSFSRILSIIRNYFIFVCWLTLKKLNLNLYTDIINK